MMPWKNIENELPKDLEENLDEVYLCEYEEQDDGANEYIPEYYKKYGVFQYSEDEDERIFYNEHFSFNSHLLTKENCGDNDDLIGEWTAFGDGCLLTMTNWTKFNKPKEEK